MTPDGAPTLTPSRHLEEGMREQVLALLARVESHDGVAAVGEEGLLELRSPHRDVSHWVLTAPAPAADPPSPNSGAPSPVVGPPPPNSGAPSAEGVVVGYAWSDGRSGELAVDPALRRRGHGSLLLEAVLAAEPSTALWAHGALPGSLAFGEHHGLHVTRDLWQMRWEVGDVVVGDLPAGYGARAFTGAADGPDGAALVAANAVVFAHHPEQGRFSTEDLARRMGEDWWDPERLRLIEHAPSGELAGFGWVKPGAPSDELYLVGVSEAHRGRGLAGWLVRDAQATSAARGASAMNLYVEGDNVSAIRSYRGAGFELDSRDVQLSVVQ